MKLALNPTPKKIASIIGEAHHKAAKWLKDCATGDAYYWPAEDAFHSQIAVLVGAEKYEKGIAVISQ